MWRISCLDKDLLASQEGICSIALVLIKYKNAGKIITQNAVN